MDKKMGFKKHLDELGKATLARYTRNASQDAAQSAYKAGEGGAEGGKNFSKSMKRLKGIQTATHKLAMKKEEFELEESMEKTSLGHLAAKHFDHTGNHMYGDHVGHSDATMAKHKKAADTIHAHVAKKYGKSTADAMKKHSVAMNHHDNEGTGDYKKSVQHHKDFVKNHLGGHGSAEHKTYKKKIYGGQDMGGETHAHVKESTMISPLKKIRMDKEKADRANKEAPKRNPGTGLGKVKEDVYSADMKPGSDGRMKPAHRISFANRGSDATKKKQSKAQDKENMKEEYLHEKLTSKDSMGKWIKDFQKSDAPQFKGKSDKEIQKMAIAAKLEADRESKNEEKLDELSPETHKSYQAKAYSDAAKGMAKKRMGTMSTKDAYDNEVKRYKGIDTSKYLNRKQHGVKEEVELDESNVYFGTYNKRGDRDKGGIVKSKENMRKVFRDLAAKRDARMAAAKNEENLDELSRDTISSYKKKATSSAVSNMIGGQGSVKTMDKRIRGIKMADKKLDQKKLGEENLDELSKSTLGKYIVRASGNRTMAAWHGGRKEKGAEVASKAGDKEKSAAQQASSDRMSNKSVKRQMGIQKAVKRLSKEETEQLDELSPKTLKSYQKKNLASLGGDPTKRDPKKFEKRSKGYQQAGKRLAKNNPYDLYHDHKDFDKAHKDIHSAVTKAKGMSDKKAARAHVGAAMKKHSHVGAMDTASREQIHRHAGISEAVGTSAKYANKTGLMGGKYKSHDHAITTKNFSQYRDDRSKKRDAEHKAQDPKMAKMGYAKHMVDTKKAAKKANARGVSQDAIRKNTNWQNKNGVAKGKLPEGVTEDSFGSTANDTKKIYVTRYDNKGHDKHGSLSQPMTKLAAQIRARMGSERDKVGGKYTVHSIDKKGRVSEALTSKDIKQGIGIARDKRYAQGNMTGAVKTMDKLKKGLSSHPRIKDELRKQNEDMTPDQKDARYDMIKKAAEKMKAKQAKMAKKAERDAKRAMANESTHDEPANDQEGSMAMGQLAFISYASKEVKDYMEADGGFPEWLQNKLTKAHEVMKDIHAYIEGERQQDGNDDEMEESTQRINFSDFLNELKNDK